MFEPLLVVPVRGFHDASGETGSHGGCGPRPVPVYDRIRNNKSSPR
jgi:hypothetical protein